MRLPDDILHQFAQLGIESVGQLQAMPRSSLPGRFGPLVLRRLDQMFGSVPELIQPCRIRPQIQARCTFEYPTDRRAYVQHALESLLDRLVTILRENHRGAKHVECWFYHEAAEPERIDIRLFRPSRSVPHLGKLLRARLERLRLSEPVSALCLRAPLVERLSDRQFELFDEEEPRHEELAALIDSLVSRLGREAVTFPFLVPDPQPEYACRFEPAIATDKRPKRNSKPALDIQVFFHRPVQMLPAPAPLQVLALNADKTPARFRRDGHEYNVTRSWGPERIETGWWRGNDIHRDYYIAETDCGSRWWLFRNADERWFLHGCFD